MERARQLSVPSVSPVNVTPVNVPIRSIGVAAPVVGPNIPIPIQQPEQKIEFDTKEEAESAFRELLKESVSFSGVEFSLKQIGRGNKP